MVPPICVGDYAFKTEAALMGAALVSWVSTMIIYYGCRARAARVVGNMMLICSLLLAPVATEHAVGLLNCQSSSLTPSEAINLDGGGGRTFAFLDLNSTMPVPVSLLASDTFFVCFQVNSGDWCECEKSRMCQPVSGPNHVT